MLPRFNPSRYLHPRVAELWAEHNSARRSYILGAFVAASISLVLALGSSDRLAAQAFSSLNAAGGKWPWACVWALAAAALAVAPTRQPRTVIATLYIVASLHVLLASGFCLAALQSPLASFMGVVVFAAQAAHLVSAAEFYRTGR